MKHVSEEARAIEETVSSEREAAQEDNDSYQRMRQVVKGIQEHERENAGKHACGCMHDGTYICGDIEAVDKDAHHHEWMRQMLMRSWHDEKKQATMIYLVDDVCVAMRLRTTSLQ